MGCQDDIGQLIQSVEKTKRKPKPRYHKTQAIRDFEKEYKTWYYSSRRIPPQYQVLTKFRDDTANELTKLIVAYLKVRGAFATRLNSTGIYRNDRKRFVPNTQRRGMADVIAVYGGKSLNIEVKIGCDKLSGYQNDVRDKINACDGFYFVARNFAEFKEWFEDL